MPRFYSVIIGTELLNGRRSDAHFAFVNQALRKRNWEHAGSMLIDDKPELMENLFRMIASEEGSVMFCFGGIGATPDDYTRQVAARVFTDGNMAIHPEGEAILKERFGGELTRKRLQLVNFPAGASLLTNVVNGVPGFYLKERFFFAPGFPDMAHPMVDEALDRFYPQGEIKYRKSMVLYASEGSMIDLMEELPVEVEFSSLPNTDNSVREVELSFAGYDEALLEKWRDRFCREAAVRGYDYKII